MAHTPKPALFPRELLEQTDDARRDLLWSIHRRSPNAGNRRPSGLECDL